MNRNFIIIIVTIFIVLGAVIYAMKSMAPDYSFNLLMGGNTLMALLSLISSLIVRKQMHERPEAFVRGVYSATFLKLMICMISIFMYVMINKPNIHKPSLFVVFGIYFIYTAAETTLLTKLAKKKV